MTDKQTSEFKPCPFCEGEATFMGYYGSGNSARGRVVCNDDDCPVDESWSRTEDEAIKAWNNRPIEAKLQQRVDELEKEVAELKEIEWYFDGDCNTYDGKDSEITNSNFGYGEYVKAYGARIVDTRYFIQIPLTLDDDGDIDEAEQQDFDSAEEALAAFENAKTALAAREGK